MDRRELDKNRPPMGGAYTSWKNIKWNTRLGSLILGFWDSKFHLSREKNNKTYSLFRTCGLYFIVLSVYPISKWTLIYSFGSITVARPKTGFLRRLTTRVKSCYFHFVRNCALPISSLSRVILNQLIIFFIHPVLYAWDSDRVHSVNSSACFDWLKILFPGLTLENTIKQKSRIFNSTVSIFGAMSNIWKYAIRVYS